MGEFLFTLFVAYCLVAGFFGIILGIIGVVHIMGCAVTYLIWHPARNAVRRRHKGG